ncbi:glycosidase [candidate division KSB1 bacterium]|nr:glycosidase [candidate division KSB1 bacterium]
MNSSEYNKKIQKMMEEHEEFLKRPNVKIHGNGVFDRYKYPVLTNKHAPVFWRYDLHESDNPYLMERIGINCTFNSGAIHLNGKFYLIARVEGFDRKSFLAVAESPNGVDNFRFWDYPVVMPETEDPDTNVYDMRIIKHEDGWLYGVFCTERKDPNVSREDTSSAIAQCGVARTKDMKTWERLDDVKTNSPQQRNVVLHPEFVNGKYAFYTRPQDGFLEAGTGGGIGWGLSASIEHAVIDKEEIIDDRQYHTIKELKNGQGPAPIKTKKGWLHLAHGVRGTAAGLRYTLYLLLSKLDQPNVVTHSPGGFFIAPDGEERIGDVSNVVFCNGWASTDNGDVYIYYASSDTRQHVATTTIDRLLDYVMNTPPDPLRSFACVQQRIKLINKNMSVLKELNLK